MSRLFRGLWHAEVRYHDRIRMEPPYPVGYDQAAITAALAGEDGARSAILRRVPGTRAGWEFVAPYEATDAPRWGEEER